MLPAILAVAGEVGGASAAAGAAAGGAEAGVAARSVAQLGQVQGAIGQVGQAAHQSSDLIGKLAGTITGKMAKALTLWIGWVEAAAKPIENLVRVANPAIADAFGRAISDAFGVVGRMLIPVMNEFTVVARKVGNVLAGLEPVFRPAIAAIANLVEVVGDEFVKLATENAPVFELMADVIVKVAEAAAVAARVIGELADRLARLPRFIARQLGFDGSSFNRNASSMGAAARQARFVQPKEISNDAIRNSLLASIGQKSPEQNQKRTADATEGILKWLERNGLFGGKAAGTAGESGAASPAAGLADNIPQVRLMRWAMAQMR